MARKILVLALAPLVLHCGPERQPSAEYKGEPWASLRAMGDSFSEAARVGENADAAGSDRENADGGRYLVEIALNQFGRGVFSDPDYPVFRPEHPETAHTAMVNPDNLYESTSIRPDVDYLVRGTRGTAADLVFQVYAGSPGVEGRLRDIGTLSAGEMEFDEDGKFELHIGPTPHAANWIETDDEAGLLLVRWSHSDWANERPGRIEIIRPGSEGIPSPGPEIGGVSRGIRAAGVALPDAGQFWIDFVSRIRLFVPDNGMTKLRETGSHGLQGQVSAMGQFSMAEDEALIVSVPKADAPYQGLQLGNHWFDSLEWVNRQTSLSAGQSHLASDGRYYYVISERDPGVPNWLDTTGLPEGLFFLRFQGLRTPIADEDLPTADRVPLQEVRKRLPSDTPFVDATQRRAQLAERQIQVQRRYNR